MKITRKKLTDVIKSTTVLQLPMPKAAHTSTSIKVLSLFSGAGLLDYGIWQAIPCMSGLAIEFDKYAANTYTANIPHSVLVSDINKVAITDIPFKPDLVIGGPPCQGFSTATQATIKLLGLQKFYHDTLNQLYKEYFRFVDGFKPKAFLLENVVGMVKFGVADEIVRMASQLGYNAEWRVLDASSYGVPQKRKRLMIQGVMGQKPIWPVEITEERPLPLKVALEGLPAIPAPFYEDHFGGYYDHITRSVSPADLEIMSYLKHGDMYDSIPEELRRCGPNMSFKDKYHRLDPNKPCKTILAHLAKDGRAFIHPYEDRYLSVREAARIQTVPDHFRFSGSMTSRYRQVGNGVPVELAYHLGICMGNYL